MNATNATIPSSAVVAASFVLSYSFICLGCGILLVVVLHLSREKFSYVFLFAVSTTCSTVVNIVQQINYLANWKILRIEQYQASLAAYNKPSLALGPLSKGFNEILFWIVLYFYNVDSVLMLFWAIALVIGVWNWKSPWLHDHERWMSAASKVAAWILPALVVGLRKSYQVHLGFATAVVLLNILMLCSFSIGTICITTILIKYLRSRLGMGSYGPGTLPASVTTGTGMSRSGWSGLKMRVDPWLVLRFTIAFVILSALEVFLVTFEIKRYNNIQHSEKVDAPNFGAGATIEDILNYIPGVTASLLAFLLFGTTGPLRAIYASIFESLNPFKRSRRLGSPKPQPQSSLSWSRVEDDLEMTKVVANINKGTSFEVSVTDRSDHTCNEFDRQIIEKEDRWYPGRKIGILDDIP